MGAILCSAWLVLMTAAGLFSELGRVPTRFREWPHRVATLLGLAGSR